MTDSLRAELELASTGLVYSSESDRPFTFLRLQGFRVPIDTLTPTDLASAAGNAGARAEEVPLSRFLAAHLSQVDPADTRSAALIPRYEALRDLLRRRLGRVRVFRLGAIEIRCLLVGNDPMTGEVVGVETVAVET
jgi:hypothetical protein